jgi:hypothetical protein
MVTLSDAETTEEARLASMRGSEPPDEGAGEQRATMPAPPVSLGRFSIELPLGTEDVDFRALFERGAFREALAATRERLATSPADTTALRIAQRSEEALVTQLLRTLGVGDSAVAELEPRVGMPETPREMLVWERVHEGITALDALLANVPFNRVEALDAIVALRDRGALHVNLSDRNSTST